jgi:predicted CXXCH cytochrome family protein
MRGAAVLMAGLSVVWIVAFARPLRAQDPQQAATEAFREDVHARAGLTCASCHAPSRSPAAGQEAYAPIARKQIAPMCAKCHADAVFMRKYAPQVRVDQYAQYLTSVHGQQMTAGNDSVATCSDCHHPHGVLPVADARAPVAPANVAATCGRCHADPARMEPFKRSPDIPAEWAKSVHAEALLVRGDRSAPTCNTCHGSHGATPPGVDAVVNVCAQCHVREAELFGASKKHEIFQSIGQADCLVCHSNHRIERPNDAWIGLTAPALCATCHDDTTDSGKTITLVAQGFGELARQTSAAASVLERATTAGMLVDDGAAALRAANEAHIRMRVLVHAFAAPPFSETLNEGLKAAASARTVGDQAMAELQFRRKGLGIATLLIVGFLATLFLKIRRLPPVQPTESRDTDRSSVK